MLKRLLAYLDHLIYQILYNIIDSCPNRLIKLVAYYYPDARLRKRYLHKLGVEMGENTFSNFGLQIITDGSNSNRVIIGNNVSIGPNLVLIVCSMPNNGKEINKFTYIRNRASKQGAIYIEDDVWIGANVTILPNVRIGKCAVIGAGAVVLSDIPPGAVAAGIPAKVIKKITI